MVSRNNRSKVNELVAVEDDDQFVDTFQAEFMGMPYRQALKVAILQRINRIRNHDTYVRAMQIIQNRSQKSGTPDRNGKFRNRGKAKRRENK